MDEDMDMGAAAFQPQPEFQQQQLPPQVLDDGRKMLYVTCTFHPLSLFVLPPAHSASAELVLRMEHAPISARVQ